MKRYFAEAEVESAQKGAQARKDEPGMTELYEHNRTACEATLSLLKEPGKVAVIHPTGMGNPLSLSDSVRIAVRALCARWHSLEIFQHSDRKPASGRRRSAWKHPPLYLC